MADLLVHRSQHDELQVEVDHGHERKAHGAEQGDVAQDQQQGLDDGLRFDDAGCRLFVLARRLAWRFACHTGFAGKGADQLHDAQQRQESGQEGGNGGGVHTFMAWQLFGHHQIGQAGAEHGDANEQFFLVQGVHRVPRCSEVQHRPDRHGPVLR